MRIVLVLALVLLGSTGAVASPTPGSRLSMSTLLDVSRLPTRQVLVMPVAATPTTLETLQLRITKPTTVLLKGERRCGQRAR